MLFGFRNIAIIAKIAVPATIVAVVSIGIVLYASLAVTQLSETAAALVDGNATRVQFALQAESAFNSAAVSEKNVILSTDEKTARGHIANYDKATAATLDAITRFEAITQAADQRALIETFRTAVGNRRQASAKVFELALAGKAKEAFEYSVGVAAKFRQVATEAVGKLIVMNVAQMGAARNASVDMAAHTRAWLVIGAAGGLICAFGILGWIALYQISRPLSFMTAEMTKLANGDLGIQIEGADRSDEVGGLARSLQVFKENAITGAPSRGRARAGADPERAASAGHRRAHFSFRCPDPRSIGHAERGVDRDASDRRKHVGHRGGNQHAGQGRGRGLGPGFRQWPDGSGGDGRTACLDQRNLPAGGAIGSGSPAPRLSRPSAPTPPFRASTDTAQKIGDVVALIRDIAAPDQPAGAQRDDRGGAGRRGRQGLCGGGQRGEGAGDADRARRPRRSPRRSRRSRARPTTRSRPSRRSAARSARSTRSPRRLPPPSRSRA